MTSVRALIVDDSKVMRLMVMKGLRQARLARFDYDQAEDGVQGLESFDNNPPDIVFVDWNMPRMTGIEMIREIRDKRGNQEVMIVLVTSEKTPSKIHEAVDEAGADAYIAKPFTPEQIESTVGPLVEALEQGTGRKSLARD